MLWLPVVGVTSGRPPLSRIGDIIDKEINKIPTIYENVEIDKYVIMPNHIHIIILLNGNETGDPRSPLQFLALLNILRVQFQNK